jgi:hypothetical protein
VLAAELQDASRRPLIRADLRKSFPDSANHHEEDG